MNDQQIRNGKIVRSAEPLNLEMPFEKLDGFITPTELFYVRMHYAIPKIDRTKWRLRVEGEVERAFELNFDELTKLASKRVAALLECAGNSRIFLEPKVSGVQWGLGAVGNANWTGVPLSILLDRAGVKQAAREVILEGADEGPAELAGGPHGKVCFARSIPLAKAREDALLAYKINDVDLPAEHGFPVRAIVPGWYAVASVKWLQRVIVIDRPFNGYYQTLDYAFWKRVHGNPELEPLRKMPIKSEIAQPMEGETVPVNSKVRVRGAAWTGEGEVAKVELTVDGGATWNETKLDEAKPNAWRLWEFDWQTPATAEKRILIARATDSKGRTQPAEHDPDRGAYMINHLLPINVEVR
ncbi:sulfite oxidase [Pedosphaera parvula]|uniref:Nitrate reductase (NADH) n=1 Tax=Pedosphaera parvula (strain Ellin514) TaxID=320771 RepID=B9XML0_PEDPL|nr:sulfite oxidase [Pedosphaera parvula]EEF58909.1 Nitrate reductase (NADH) [Pedosphaera parvula Ellin514]